jgi:hypothetical protein
MYPYSDDDDEVLGELRVSILKDDEDYLLRLIVTRASEGKRIAETECSISPWRRYREEKTTASMNEQTASLPQCMSNKIVVDQSSTVVDAKT